MNIVFMSHVLTTAALVRAVVDLIAGEGGSRKSRIQMLNRGDHRQWTPLHGAFATPIAAFWCGWSKYIHFVIYVVHSSSICVCAVAAAAGKLGVVKLLLAAGCSASLRNDEGLTALELAEQLEQSGVAGVLRAHINRPIQMHKSLTLDS